MGVSNATIAFWQDQLSGLGPVQIKRMFGGAGVYADGVMFGLIADDVLYLKADAQSCRAYEADGMGPFVYEGKGKPVTMSYWQVPERLTDEPDEMTAWSKVALEVARRGAAKRTKRPS